jgi:hypothetical protein
MIIYSISVGYAIDRVLSWGEPVTGRSINGFEQFVALPGGLGRLPGDHEAGVALVQDVAGGEVGVWGSGGQDR